MPVWSVAPNKLVSKVATRLVKPTGEYVVGESEEAAFLAPLPIHLLPGIEREDLALFRKLNLKFVHEVVGLTLDQLDVFLGKRAGFVFEAVRGIDASPVLPAGSKPPRMIAEHEFGNDTNDVKIVESILYGLTETVGLTLRKQGKSAGMLAVTIDHTDGVRRVRHMRVSPPSHNDISLFKIARSILSLAWIRRIRLRHIRLTCEKIVFPPAQIDLFPDPYTGKQEALIAAMDRVRERFGQNMIRMGRVLTGNTP